MRAGAQWKRALYGASVGDVVPQGEGGSVAPLLPGYAHALEGGLPPLVLRRDLHQQALVSPAPSAELI